MIGASIANIGLGLLNSNSQKKQAKQTLAANTDIANKTLAQQQDQFNSVKDAAGNYIDMGKNADINGNNYQSSPGFDAALHSGQQSVLGSNALNGLLRSSAAIKALSGYTTNQVGKDFNTYVDQQQQNAGIGLQGVNALSGAASGNAAALSQNAANITNANNTASSDINSANNGGFNAVGAGLGGLASSPTVNGFLTSALAKLKTPQTPAVAGSSYQLPITGQTAYSI